MNLKENLFKIITTLNSNRPVSIKSDKEKITVKKHKKNDIVDVWLFYKIKNNFKELYHITTTTKCSQGDINDIVEDMSLEIPKDLRESKQEEMQLDNKQDKNWYDTLNADERELCLCKYALLVYTLFDECLQSGFVEDADVVDFFSFYGLDEKDLKLLGVIS